MLPDSDDPPSTSSTDHTNPPSPPPAVNCCDRPGVRTAVRGVIEKPDPVPDSAIVCGAPGALSVTEIVANRLPVATGVKVDLIVHVPPGASDAPQVWTCAKSPVFAPEMTMLPIVNVAAPAFVRVTVWALLDVPAGTLPKSSAAALRTTAGTMLPVPLFMSAWICVGVKATL